MPVSFYLTVLLYDTEGLPVLLPPHTSIGKFEDNQLASWIQKPIPVVIEAVSFLLNIFKFCKQLHCENLKEKRLSSDLKVKNGPE